MVYRPQAQRLPSILRHLPLLIPQQQALNLQHAEHGTPAVATTLEIDHGLRQVHRSTSQELVRWHILLQVRVRAPEAVECLLATSEGTAHAHPLQNERVSTVQHNKPDL